MSVKQFVISKIYRIKREIHLKKYYLSNLPNEIKVYKNKHDGQRCFIIGNGPSLTAEDLNLLKNEVTFAANRIYNIFDRTDWRPTYYVVQDTLLLNEIKEKANKVEAKKRFFPINMKWLYNYDFKDDDVAFYLNLIGFYPDLPKFSTDISKQIYEGYTVTYGAIQLAVYMGFTEIYLLGVDFNYSVTINNEGKIMKHKGVKDYFSDDNNENLNLPDLEKSLLAFKAAEKFANENGLKIYNATRGGKLEVFERIELDVLFNKNLNLINT